MLCPLLDFLTLEAETDMLSQNVTAELPPYAESYHRKMPTPHDVATQALVWLHVVLFRMFQCGTVHVSVSYVNLR